MLLLSGAFPPLCLLCPLPAGTALSSSSGQVSKLLPSHRLTTPRVGATRLMVLRGLRGLALASIPASPTATAPTNSHPRGRASRRSPRTSEELGAGGGGPVHLRSSGLHGQALPERAVYAALGDQSGGSEAWRAARTLAPCPSSLAAGCASSWRGAKDSGVPPRSREPAHILSGPATSHSFPLRASAGAPGKAGGAGERASRRHLPSGGRALAGPQPQFGFVYFGFGGETV